MSFLNRQSTFTHTLTCKKRRRTHKQMFQNSIIPPSASHIHLKAKGADAHTKKSSPSQSIFHHHHTFMCTPRPQTRTQTNIAELHLVPSLNQTSFSQERQRTHKAIFHNMSESPAPNQSKRMYINVEGVHARTKQFDKM